MVSASRRPIFSSIINASARSASARAIASRSPGSSSASAGSGGTTICRTCSHAGGPVIHRLTTDGVLRLLLTDDRLRDDYTAVQVLQGFGVFKKDQVMEGGSCRR